MALFLPAEKRFADESADAFFLALRLNLRFEGPVKGKFSPASRHGPNSRKANSLKSHWRIADKARSSLPVTFQDAT